MKITFRQPRYVIRNGQKVIEMVTIDPSEVVINEPSILSIDGSSSNTGLSVIRLRDCSYIYTASLARDDGKVNPIRYKIQFKAFIDDFLSHYKMVTNLYYEEPILGYAEAIPVLMTLRTTVEELIIEKEPAYDYVSLSYVNNKFWKKNFLAPLKLPGDSKLEKKMVREKLVSMFPCMEVLTEDECDACGMGWVVASNLKNGGTDEDVAVKKKTRPFKYEIELIGADEDNEAFNEINCVYSGPKKVRENGVEMVEIHGKEKFDQTVYNTMGEADKIVIVKFPSTKYGNIILKMRAGILAEDYDYMYAVVWRTSRKYN